MESADSAVAFADFLWGAFGPVTTAWTTAGKPRPFGNAVVDGFDFDIESYIDPAPADAPNYQWQYYSNMINHFKNDLYPSGGKTYYISGAPQCVVPDAHMADAIANSPFDFIFVQFYNTPSCSSRAGINYIAGTSATDITFDAWTNVASKNPNAKIYLGLVSVLYRIWHSVTDVVSSSLLRLLLRRATQRLT